MRTLTTLRCTGGAVPVGQCPWTSSATASAGSLQVELGNRPPLRRRAG